MTFSDPIKSATEMARQIRVRNILNPLLWALPFLVAALVVVTIFSDNSTIQSFFMIAIGAEMIVILLTFIAVMLFGDPKLLQSEDHTFNMKALEVLGDQKHNFVDVKDSPIVNNPAEADPKNVEIPPPRELNKPTNDHE